MSSQCKSALALCLLGGIGLLAQAPVSASERAGVFRTQQQETVQPERAFRAPRDTQVERAPASSPTPQVETQPSTTERRRTTEQAPTTERRRTTEQAPTTERRQTTERRPVASREPSFDHREQETIRRWYHERNQQPGAGMESGRRDLPPGLQRRVQRGGELPPGWQRKVEPGMTMSQEQLRYARRPSQELVEQLPEQPEGTVLVESDDQVVRVMERTGKVLDVLGIGRGR